MISNVAAKSVIDADGDLTVKGNYNASHFAFGNNIDNKADIDGISLNAGNNINIKGSSPYAFIAGNTISINGKVEKDLFVAGNSINIGSDAKIGRDIYIAGNDVKINVDVERNLRVAGTSLDISGITIKGNVYTAVEEITMDKDTVIEGTLNYYDDTVVTGLDEATISNTKVLETPKVSITIYDNIIAQIMSAIAGFIVMVVLFYMLPKSKELIDEEEMTFSNVLSSVGKGFAMLIVLPLIGFIALFTGILVPLSLIILALYLIFIYLASLISSYLIGRELVKRVFKTENLYLYLATGILLIKLIALIPIVGFIVSAICFLFGLGVIYKIILNARNN